jgi:hypothetical protein
VDSVNGNTSLGISDLTNNTTGFSNTAVGYESLQPNTTGYNNTAVGHYALNSNTAGAWNTALGDAALADNIYGNNDTAIGGAALQYGTGDSNTALGYAALHFTTTGAYNTGLGTTALYENQTGSYNSVIGNSAGEGSGCSSGAGCSISGLTIQGYKAGYSLQTGSDYSTLIGYESGLNITTATGNVGVGAYTLSASGNTGADNTAVGYESLQDSTTGWYNTASGAYALQYNTSGSNTAFGAYALESNTTGYNNTASGTLALLDNTTGYNNTASGYNVLRYNTTGSDNVALGYQAGYTSTSANANTSGSYNTFLGYNSGPGTTTQLQNATAIGAYSTVDSSNSIVLGSINGINGATSSTDVGIGTASPSSTLDVVGNSTGFASIIENADSATTSGQYTSSSDGLLIELGTPEASWTTGNTFVAFGDTSGNIDGNISAVAGGGVSYNTTGADYGEYFSFSAGSSLVNNSNTAVSGTSSSSTNYFSSSNTSGPINTMPTANYMVSLTSDGGVALSNNTAPIGIVSKQSGFIGNGPNCNTKDLSCLSDYYANHVLVALRGQVPLEVTNINGDIKVGDPITASDIPGVGELATTTSYIVGYALTSCSTTSGTIQVLVQPGLYTPSIMTYLQNTNPIFDSLTINNGLNIGGSLNVSGDSTLANLTVNGNTSINGNLSVLGMTNVMNITVGGHIITAGVAPQVSILPNGGTNATVTISGNDTSGIISISTGSDITSLETDGQTVTSGSNPSSGDLVKVSFNTSYGKVPNILITPNNSLSATLLVYPDQQSINGFKVGVVGTPQPNTTYSFDYFIVQ